MPYALNCTPSSGRGMSIFFPAPTPNASGHYDYYYKFVVKGSLTECPLFADINLGAATSTKLYFLKGTQLEIRSTNNANTITNHGVVYGEFNEYLVRHTFTGGAKERKVYVNGSSTPVSTHTLSDISGFKVEVLFPFGNSSRGGELRTLQFVDVYGGVNKTYDADLSGGTGNILPPDGVQTGTWPSDDSEWVFYSGGNTQAITSGGTVSRTAVAVAVTQAMQAQQFASGGSATVLRSAEATTVVVNDTGVAQEVSSGGVVNRTTALTAASSVDNTQAETTSGSVSRSHTATALTQITEQQTISSSGQVNTNRGTAATAAVVQAQEISTAGSVTITRSGVASTQAVNTLSEVQAVSSGGVVTRSTSASALTQITEVQGITTGGTAIAQRNAVASTQAVNDFTVVQAVSSGGVCSVVRDAAAIVQVINHQQFESAGRVSRQLSVYAETVIFDDGYTPEFSIIGLTASVHQQNLSATLNRQKLTAEVRRSTYSANYIQ